MHPYVCNYVLYIVVKKNLSQSQLLRVHATRALNENTLSWCAQNNMSCWASCQALFPKNFIQFLRHVGHWIFGAKIQKDVEVMDEEIVELVVDLNEAWLNLEDKFGDWGTTFGNDFLYFLDAQYCANFWGNKDSKDIFNWDTIVGNNK